MSLESQNWETLQALFHLAEETPEEERERVLSEHCSDPKLVRRTMDILRGAEALKEIHETPPEPVHPTRMGPYTLLRLIGSGGIGTVYLAERLLGGAPQRVALKVLAPHAAGPEFVERFHREQHILASLDHPHITRMIDAGMSAAGQPYLVMEFVDGELLTAWCDARRLTVEQRIELFLQVCDAVGYAHRNLVVHLDLKPSNILVAAESGAESGRQGGVKLLDFGTSKLILPDISATTTVLATPAYASPEQLRNEPVTTACDIYSLGAIFYELLSGRRTAESTTVIFERAMNERDPDLLPGAVTAEAAEARGTTAERLAQSMKGDLATIAAKCLRARPRERYATVDALAEDLRRYLDGRTVLARPQTALYRVGKFVRRNVAAVVATVVIGAALAASLGYAAWRQHQAVLAGQRAMRMQTFLYRLLYLANSNYTGKPAMSVPEFLNMGVKVLPSYIQNPGDLREAQLALAESMFENGANDDAKRVFAQVIDSARATGDTNAEAEAEAPAGYIAYMQGDIPLSEKLTAHALELSRRSGTTPEVRVWSAVYYVMARDERGFLSDDNLKMLEAAVKEAQKELPQREIADAFYNLGLDYQARRRYADSKSAYSSALHLYEQDPQAQCDQADVYGRLAFVEDKLGGGAASLPVYQRAYDGAVSCSGAASRNALLLQGYVVDALLQRGHAQEALSMMEAAMPMWRKITGEAMPVEPLRLLALAYAGTGNFAAAERAVREGIDLQNGKMAADDPRSGELQLILARALAGQKRYAEALPHAETAGRILGNASSPAGKPLDAEARQVLLGIQSNLKH